MIPYEDASSVPVVTVGIRTGEWILREDTSRYQWRVYRCRADAAGYRRDGGQGTNRLLHIHP